MRTALAAWLFIATLSLPACTPLRVVTHTVDPDPVEAQTGLYKVDTDHASLTFDVDHLGFSRFAGRFNTITGTLDFDAANPARSSLSITIPADSIDTPVDELDRILKSDQMFDVDRYPEITFVSKEIERTGPNSGRVTGALTLHGVTRNVTLDVNFNGSAANPLTGNPTLGFAAKGAVRRSAFGLGTWIPAVGDEVQFEINIEFVAGPAAPAPQQSGRLRKLLDAEASAQLVTNADPNR